MDVNGRSPTSVTLVIQFLVLVRRLLGSGSGVGVMVKKKFLSLPESKTLALSNSLYTLLI